MWLVVSVVAAVVLVATYLTWVAARVDRLHARADAAGSALEAQCLRRAAAAADLGDRHGLAGVAAAARLILETPEPDEGRENALTRVLRTDLATTAVASTETTAVSDASKRLALARQVYTDVVRDARAVRRHPAARLFRFARRHPEPRFFDIDDPTL